MSKTLMEEFEEIQKKALDLTEDNPEALERAVMNYWKRKQEIPAWLRWRAIKAGWPVDEKDNSLVGE